MALGILKGAWRSLLLRRLLPGELHGAASLPLLLRGAQAAQAAPQRCASHSASRGALLAPTAGEHVRSGLGAAAYCEASADARTDARSPPLAEGWARAGELPGAASASQGLFLTQAGPRSGWGAHGTTGLRSARPALAQQLRQNALAELHSTAGLYGAPCLWRRQQQRGFVNFLPGLNGDVSKQYHERRLIGYAPEQLFSVVADVAHYAEFVPWCQRSEVLVRRDMEYVEAELEVGFKLFVERYTSQVHLEQPTKVVSHVYDSTLFDHLDSTWRFAPGPLPGSCWLDFGVDFAFKSPLYRHIALVFFDEVVKRMMCAFEGRCKVLYGPSALDRAREARKQPAGDSAATRDKLRAV